MAFERIKKIKGHEYRYLVENYRIKEGIDKGKIRQRVIKNLGREDKEQVNDNCLVLKIPYGFYYFAQKSCMSCDTPEQLNHSFELLKQVLKDEIPQIKYIDLSKDGSPIPIPIRYTPTMVDVCVKGFYMGGGDFNGWLEWRFGTKRAADINDATQQLYSQREEEITSHIHEGKNEKQLIELGYNGLDIETVIERIRTEKNNERQKARIAKKLSSLPVVIDEKECIIGRPTPICNECEYGRGEHKGFLKGHWGCNEYDHNFKCGNDSCKLEEVKKCEVCGFTMWNKYVFAAHMKEVHSQG